MAKYRIVKLGRYINLYKVQKRAWVFFWWDDTGIFSLKECEDYIETEIRLSKAKDIVVREY